MTVSLLEIAQSNGILPALPESEIHYPPEDHAQLARVEGQHFWFTERRRVILRLLKKYLRFTGRNHGFCGLDVGCGSGFTAIWLTQLGLPTVGMDAHFGFEESKKRGSGFGFIHGDIMSVEPKPEFDFLLLLDTIEHIPDDSSFLDHVGKALKPGGIAIITVPAFEWLWSEVDDRAGHQRRYTRKDIQPLTRLPGTRFSLKYSSYYFATLLPLHFLVRRFGKRRKPDADAGALESAPGMVNRLIQMALRVEAFFFFYSGIALGTSLFVVLEKEPATGLRQ